MSVHVYPELHRLQHCRSATRNRKTCSIDLAPSPVRAREGSAAKEKFPLTVFQFHKGLIKTFIHLYLAWRFSLHECPEFVHLVWYIVFRVCLPNQRHSRERNTSQKGSSCPVACGFTSQKISIDCKAAIHTKNCKFPSDPSGFLLLHLYLAEAWHWPKILPPCFERSFLPERSSIEGQEKLGTKYAMTLTAFLQATRRREC